ncbi:tRNA lysidine(34) synthetase TilS [Rhodoferax saidenbachensis]|uniref:tRNA(Ile)-lysidine synthase n=1 Tax=Rhodoferax saidenbachensis TaxID=1484693 RepID=A0ABU1ZS80_9BURK|nr:tRNA lysidine(34) synthetase TilS [Rhodoferax saidenbachensis]MDR7308406.1 tRNA(Ile)-lysidine synthase [Rhodoferax saidenbachensis]
MTQSLDAALRAFQPALPLGVAFSGGADSTALLITCAERWPGQVVALHVNHGLQAAAADFETRCAALCAQLDVPLRVLKVDAGHASGQSPEDAARIARYKAFGALARVEYAQEAIKSIALAQHADDQVETLLLALSRGAGLRGLSAMPAQWQRDGLDFYRPLLQVSAADIRAWLAERGASFVEDPTNTDQRFTRNRIRAQLLPALEAAFPQFRDTLARSAAHAAQAQGLLDEMAAADLLTICRANDGLPMVKALQVLNVARQANALRHWLANAYSVIPSTAQLAELQQQILACTTRGHRIHIKVAQGFVERRGPVLVWYPASTSR